MKQQCMITAAAVALIASVVATTVAAEVVLRGPAAALELVPSNNYFPNIELVGSDEEDKPRAADRRQRQRDASRRSNNPNRTAEEDAREGRRKRIQHERSGRGRPDIDKEGGARRDGARSVSRERYRGNDPRGDRRRDVRNTSRSYYTSRDSGRRRRGSDGSNHRGSDGSNRRRNGYSSSTYRSNGRRRNGRDYSSSGRSCRDINKNLRRSNANASGCKVDAYGKRSIQQAKRRYRNNSDRRRDGYYSSSTWGSEDDKAKAWRHSADEVAVA